MIVISSTSNTRVNARRSNKSSQREHVDTNNRPADNWLRQLVVDPPTDPGFIPPEGYELAIVGRNFVVRAALPVHRKLVALVNCGVIAGDAMDNIFCSLVSSLWQTVFGVVASSMVVELAAAKTTGLLQGDTKVERYRFFVACLADSDFTRSILETSPVIVAQLDAISRNWEIANLELLEHVSRDREIVHNSFFSDQTSATIVAINRSQGDTHRQGRSVALIGYDCGVKLVYKPRSLSADLVFFNLAQWFNSIAGEELLAAVSTLDCGDHGWCEFIEHRALSNKTELDKYYFRLGVLLAIARTLGLSDLHSENLIAAGNWPVVVDLETLFHPLAGTFDSSTTSPRATDKLHNILKRSVFASGLLPMRPGDLKSNAAWLDMAGTSDIDGKKTPFELPYWQNTGTDEMCLAYDSRILEGDQNIPVIKGKRVLPELFALQIISGFCKAYDLMMAERDWLLSDEGPLMAFANCTVRCVFRPTQYYEALLIDGFHPTVMQSLDHKSEWLQKALNGESRISTLKGLEKSEQAALWQHDIPYFETTPDSRDIRSCVGDIKPEFLPDSGLNIARQTIEEMGRDDLARQCWMIKAALAKAETAGEQRLVKPDIHKTPCFPVPTIADCAPKIAHTAAQYLCETAVLHAECANWLTLQEASIGTLSCSPAGLDLYSGLPGIALFLSHAGAVLENNEYTKLGRAALNEVLRLIDEDKKVLLGVGGYSGVSGLAYALFEMQQHFPDMQLAQVFIKLVLSIDPETLETSPLELIDGVSGLISCLCAISENSLKNGFSAKERRFLTRLIKRCCEIVARRLGVLEGSQEADAILSHTGMAHGMAGLKCVMARARRLRLPEISGLVDTALDRLSQFETEKSKNGPDGEITRRIAWCNGLSGLTLSAALIKGTADKRLITELNDNLIQGRYLDDSLCHGSMGAVATLNYLKSTCPTALVTKIDHSIAAVVGRIDANSIRCGTIDGIQSPGLMDGMSGVGMAALSLVQPATTPMILCHESTSCFQHRSIPEQGE